MLYTLGLLCYAAGVAIGLPAAVPGGSHSSGVCPMMWQYWNGHCYYVRQIAGRWQDGEEYCGQIAGTDFQGHLASIHSEEENNFIRFNLTVNFSTAWIGLVMDQNSGAWSWSDGSYIDYLNWEDDHPVGSGCVRFFRENKGKWVDSLCTHSIVWSYSVCKAVALPPPPTTATTPTSTITTSMTSSTTQATTAMTPNVTVPSTPPTPSPNCSSLVGLWSPTNSNISGSLLILQQNHSSSGDYVPVSGLYQNSSESSCFTPIEGWVARDSQPVVMLTAMFNGGFAGKTFNGVCLPSTCPFVKMRAPVLQLTSSSSRLNMGSESECDKLVTYTQMESFVLDIDLMQQCDNRKALQQSIMLQEYCKRLA